MKECVLCYMVGVGDALAVLHSAVHTLACAVAVTNRVSHDPRVLTRTVLVEATLSARLARCRQTVRQYAQGLHFAD